MGSIRYLLKHELFYVVFSSLCLQPLSVQTIVFQANFVLLECISTHTSELAQNIRISLDFSEQIEIETQVAECQRKALFETTATVALLYSLMYNCYGLLILSSLDTSRNCLFLSENGFIQLLNLRQNQCNENVFLVQQNLLRTIYNRACCRQQVHISQESMEQVSEN